MSGNGDKQSASFEGQVELTEALDYIKSLAVALRKGTAYVQNGTDVVSLEPEPIVGMEVEARAKKDKQSLTISLQWRKTEEVVPVSVTESLAILDSAPEPAEA
jgi:amphi-Trp domain-containing protein